MDHQRLPPHYLSGMGGISGISGMKRDGKVGNLKLDLPVDEDDYLMPSPASTQTNGGYMDLIGDSKAAGSQPEAFVRNLPAIKRMTVCNGLPPPLSMDNPEYHMMSQDVHTLYNPSSPSYLSQKSPMSPLSPLSQLPVLPVGGGATLGIPVNGLGIGIMAGINGLSAGNSLTP